MEIEQNQVEKTTRRPQTFARLRQAALVIGGLIVAELSAAPPVLADKVQAGLSGIDNPCTSVVENISVAGFAQDGKNYVAQLRGTDLNTGEKYIVHEVYSPTRPDGTSSFHQVLNGQGSNFIVDGVNYANGSSSYTTACPGN